MHWDGKIRHFNQILRHYNSRKPVQNIFKKHGRIFPIWDLG